MKCRIEGCLEDRKITRVKGKFSKWGLCEFHISQRRYKLARGEEWVPKLKSVSLKCSISDCGKPHTDDYECCALHRRVMKKYSLTVEQLQELLLVKNCSICNVDLVKSKKITPTRHVIDHDHYPADDSAECTVRGVLCQNCNVGIGALKDDPALLTAAIEYLKNPPFQSDLC